MIVFIVDEKGYSAEKQILKYPKIILKKRKYPQASKIHEKNLEGRIGHNKPK